MLYRDILRFCFVLEPKMGIFNPYHGIASFWKEQAPSKLLFSFYIFVNHVFKCPFKPTRNGRDCLANSNQAGFCYHICEGPYDLLIHDMPFFLTASHKAFFPFDFENGKPTKHKCHSMNGFTTIESVRLTIQQINGPRTDFVEKIQILFYKVTAELPTITLKG